MTSYARTGYLGFVRRTELTQSDGGSILFHAYAHLPVTFHPGHQTGLVMQSDCISGVGSLIPARSHTFEEINHEIISMVILLLPLIQEGLLSVTSESMSMRYWLTP